MMAYPFFARRRSARSLLAVSFLASAVRWGLLSQATRPVPIAALQALHGLTYGLFWSTLVELVGAQVPPRLRATGLALCQALVFGVGTAVGAKLGGLGYDHDGSVGPLFLWAAGADLLLALGVVGLLAQRRLRGEAPPPADPA